MEKLTKIILVLKETKQGYESIKKKKNQDIQREIKSILTCKLIQTAFDGWISSISPLTNGPLISNKNLGISSNCNFQEPKYIDLRRDIRMTQKQNNYSNSFLTMCKSEE